MESPEGRENLYKRRKNLEAMERERTPGDTRAVNS